MATKNFDLISLVGEQIWFVLLALFFFLSIFFFNFFSCFVLRENFHFNALTAKTIDILCVCECVLSGMICTCLICSLPHPSCRTFYPIVFAIGFSFWNHHFSGNSRINFFSTLFAVELVVFIENKIPLLFNTT